MNNTTTEPDMFNRPNIDPTKMTQEEIVAAWRPILNALYDIIIDTLFEGDSVDNYNAALAEYASDWHKATDYEPGNYQRDMELGYDGLPF